MAIIKLPLTWFFALFFDILLIVELLGKKKNLGQFSGFMINTFRDGDQRHSNYSKLYIDSVLLSSEIALIQDEILEPSLLGNSLR